MAKRTHLTVAKVHLKQGFSLMELLIVIAIIGVLVSVAVVSYAYAQKKSRDTRRRDDLRQVQNAWEQYYADNSSTYPGTDATAPCIFSATPTPGVMSAVYLPGGLPVDPKGGTPYPDMYAGWSACTSSSFCMCAGLEGETNSTKDCAGESAPSGYGGMYCIRSLQ